MVVVELSQSHAKAYFLIPRICEYEIREAWIRLLALSFQHLLLLPPSFSPSLHLCFSVPPNLGLPFIYLLASSHLPLSHSFILCLPP